LDVLAGIVKPADLDNDEREQLWAMQAQVEATHAQAMEYYPAGRLYHQELARLGLPRPQTLRGIDLIKEALRLVAIRFLPSSDPGVPTEEEPPLPRGLV
jgi:hypothetical protein